MPKVKKKTAVKKKRKTTKKKRASGGIFETLHNVWLRFSRAMIAAFVLIALLAVAMLWSGGYFGVMAERLQQTVNAGTVAAGFEVRRITVKGLEQTGQQELKTALGPIVGSSIVGFDPFSARSRIEDIGWVRSAAVMRLYPDTVHVSVRERVPAAVWQHAGDFWA